MIIPYYSSVIDASAVMAIIKEYVVEPNIMYIMMLDEPRIDIKVIDHDDEELARLLTAKICVIDVTNLLDCDSYIHFSAAAAGGPRRELFVVNITDDFVIGSLSEDNDNTWQMSSQVTPMYYKVISMNAFGDLMNNLEQLLNNVHGMNMITNYNRINDRYSCILTGLLDINIMLAYDFAVHTSMYVLARSATSAP